MTSELMCSLIWNIQTCGVYNSMKTRSLFGTCSKAYIYNYLDVMTITNVLLQKTWQLND